MKQVGLLDVADVEGFVKAAIKRSGIRPHGDAYDELLGYGYVIICDLAQRYDPAKETRPEKASFAGYAHYLLPRKLRDAWHRMHPEHVLTSVRDENGETSRKYVYYERPTSIEALQMNTDVAMDGQGRGWQLDERELRTPGEFIPVPAKPS